MFKPVPVPLRVTVIGVAFLVLGIILGYGIGLAIGRVPRFW